MVAAYTQMSGDKGDTYSLAVAAAAEILEAAQYHGVNPAFLIEAASALYAAQREAMQVASAVATNPAAIDQPFRPSPEALDLLRSRLQDLGI